MHPAIAECACVGHTSGAHSRYGESDQDVRLFLVVKQGCEFTVAELIDYLRPRLPPYMMPRYYDVLDEMPTSVNGRIIKSKLANRPLDAGTVERASTRAANQPR
jgi:crotonobetaine/carnitine-CoA ligase